MTQTKRVSTRVWMQRLRADDEVTKVRLCTLVILGTYMDSDGSNAHVRESTLAAAVGVSERAVRDHLAYACDRGYLDRVSRGHRLGNGQTTASTYEATVPPDPEDTSTGSHTPVEDGAQQEPGRRLTPPQPEPACSSTGRSDGLNRNGDAPQPEAGRSPYKEDQVLLQEQTNLSPPSDPVAALVRRAAVVPAGDEKDFINWMKVKYPGKGPGWWRHIADNGDIHDHAADWKNERDAAAPTPKHRPRPPWCEDPACDEPTRRYERDDGRWAKCPRCHPDMIGEPTP